MGRATPLLGHEGLFHEVLGVNPIYDARAFLFGGGEVGPATLMRFYILHCIFSPGHESVPGVHFWRIRRDGFLDRPSEASEARHARVGAACSSPSSQPSTCWRSPRDL